MRIRVRKPAQLWKGDCLQEMGRIATGSVDLILTDPPYGTTANKWDSVINFAALWKEYSRVLKPNGIAVLFSAQPFTTLLIMSNLKWFRYDIIWLKNRMTGHLNAKKMPLRQHEIITIFSPAKLGNHTYNPEMTIGPVSKKGGATYEQAGNL